jgi:hypothetical protein
MAMPSEAASSRIVLSTPEATQYREEVEHGEAEHRHVSLQQLDGACDDRKEDDAHRHAADPTAEGRHVAAPSPLSLSAPHGFASHIACNRLWSSHGT